MGASPNVKASRLVNALKRRDGVDEAEKLPESPNVVEFKIKGTTISTNALRSIARNDAHLRSTGLGTFRAEVES